MLFKNTEKRVLIDSEGLVLYHGIVFSEIEANHFFEVLWKTIEWRNDEAFIYGKHYITKRKVAWYGEKPFPYSYSNTTKFALPFTEPLLEIKNKIEQISGEKFNSCLLNLYHSGEEGMAWHSDDEKELTENGCIASVTFGAERKFSFRNKRTKETVSCLLENGSLLEMKGETQSGWQHRLPPTKKIKEPRINLTFRMMKGIPPQIKY